jgi:exopolyphosphatase / guanosine-5'-triphosphate,3'-diphosphate pyrophosphatase
MAMGERIDGARRRVCAIDIGTNSVRSIIVDLDHSGSYQLVDDEKEYTRLGQGMTEDRGLTADAMERTEATLARMLSVAERFGVNDTYAIATAAVRRAPNGSAFVADVRERIGLAIDVISEEEEGRLAFVSAAANFSMEGRSAVVDVGGGSTEVTRAVGGEIDLITSLPIGAVVLAERFSAKDPMPGATFEAMQAYVRDLLTEALGEDIPSAGRMVGSGGTVNALAAMATAMRGAPRASAQGYELLMPDVVHILAKLKRSTAPERRQIAGLPPARVDIILPGTLIVAELMRAFDVNVLHVNTKGIREGFILDLITREMGRDTTLDRMQAVFAFAERCNYEAAHSLHVRDLALSLFDQLAAPLDLEREARPLLESAAVLHDVGYHIGYEQHQKHSYHLIIYSDLPGFTPRELRMVAATARYHSGSKPKQGHEWLAGLEKRDRRIVRQLAAILRFADGLDRTRDQQVTAAEATANADSIRVAASGSGDLEINLQRAREKGDLLEQLFDRTLEVSQAPA